MEFDSFHYILRPITDQTAVILLTQIQVTNQNAILISRSCQFWGENRANFILLFFEVVLSLSLSLSLFHLLHTADYYLIFTLNLKKTLRVTSHIHSILAFLSLIFYLYSPGADWLRTLLAT